jgi:hypothetical protein
MVRQCAWCWSVADATGLYRFQAGAKLPEATHGICPTCCKREMAAIDKLQFDRADLALVD